MLTNNHTRCDACTPAELSREYRALKRAIDEAVAIEDDDAIAQYAGELGSAWAELELRGCIATPDGHWLWPVDPIGTADVWENARYRLLVYRRDGRASVILKGTGIPSFDYPDRAGALRHIDRAWFELNDPCGP